MKREFLQSLQVAGNPLTKEVIDAIMAEQGKDLQAARQAAADWEDKFTRAEQSHQAQLTQLRLDSALTAAITKAGGRSIKAITALLDMEALSAQEDLPQALDRALQDLKEESGYLFEGHQAPPYARGDGSVPAGAAPLTLAGALRQRMGKKQ